MRECEYCGRTCRTRYCSVRCNRDGWGVLQSEATGKSRCARSEWEWEEFRRRVALVLSLHRRGVHMADAIDEAGFTAGEAVAVEAAVHRLARKKEKAA